MSVRTSSAPLVETVLLGILCGPLAAGCGSAPSGTKDSDSGGAASTASPQDSGKGQTAADSNEKDSKETSSTDDGPKPPPLFDGWQKPTLALFITGQQMGYIEPCGCTGLANQKGGLARRATLLKQLREEKGWQVVPLDVGNQVRRYGRQSEIKFQRTAEALRMMGYRAVSLGADDLRLTPGELFAGTNPDEKPSIFTASNVAILDRMYTPPWQVVEAAGRKIGVVSVLGDSLRKKIEGDEIVHEPAAESVRAAAEKLKADGCGLLVLLAHTSLEESRELAKAARNFDLVITAGGLGEPTLEMEKIPGTKAQMAQVGTKGMYAGVVGIFDDPQMPLRYQRVPLDSSYPDAPEMLKLLADYQEQLRREGLAGAGASEQPHPSGRKFVGTAKCGECHLKALAVWEKTPHAHATDSLVRPTTGRGDIPRHFDPECLSCHVTGWEPQKFFPFRSGYLSLEKTPHLQHNGCENCHGPGSAHVAAEEGEGKPNEEMIARLRESMRLPLAGDKAKHKCLECHDLDNDPHFKFEEYWPKIEHVGKD
ncbi:MAG TPA: multiheme c-type cytochrome [Pirellulaceae bacterium]|nr:multiheme c-type cytochrome [Pirellulaceae bacterium]